MEDATAPRHYNRAPIVEATLSIEAPALQDDKLAVLTEVGQALGREYPSPLPRDSEVAQKLHEGDISLLSADNRYVAHIRQTGFALTHLAPYDRWETFVAEFKRTSAIYESFVAPLSPHLFLVRYVNKLAVPLEIPLHRFFNVYPAMPNKDALFSRLLMLTETILDEEPKGTLTVFMYPILEDIDVEARVFPMVLGNTFSFKVQTMDAIWRNLDTIRRLKNTTFESQLTDKMKETIS